MALTITEQKRSTASEQENGSHSVIMDYGYSQNIRAKAVILHLSKKKKNALNMREQIAGKFEEYLTLISKILNRKQKNRAEAKTTTLLSSRKCTLSLSGVDGYVTKSAGKGKSLAHQHGTRVDVIRTIHQSKSYNH